MSASIIELSRYRTFLGQTKTIDIESTIVLIVPSTEAITGQNRWFVREYLSEAAKNQSLAWASRVANYKRNSFGKHAAVNQALFNVRNEITCDEREAFERFAGALRDDLVNWLAVRWLLTDNGIRQAKWIGYMRNHLSLQENIIWSTVLTELFHCDNRAFFYYIYIYIHI